MSELGTIDVHRHSDVAIVRLLGEHDLATRPAVMAQLHQEIAAGNKLVVDVSSSEFIDASILSALLAADEQLRNKQARLILLTGTSCVVKKTLDVSGISDRLALSESLPEAIALARNNPAA
jgi:anti-anti-sigma factor